METCIVTCSGVSSTGKLTTRAGLTLIHRCPGRIGCCIRADRPGNSIEQELRYCSRLLVIDGCEDCCGRKKIESLGIHPDIHIIATECGIRKRGTDDPSYSEIESLVDAIRKLIN